MEWIVHYNTMNYVMRHYVYESLFDYISSYVVIERLLLLTTFSSDAIASRDLLEIREIVLVQIWPLFDIIFISYYVLFVTW